nr:hypothetical protein [Tanacetum cinerariifolium]
IEADDQAIQTILLGLPEDIYADVDSCESAQEIWLRVSQMMKGSDIVIHEKKAKLFNEWESTECRESSCSEWSSEFGSSECWKLEWANCCFGDCKSESKWEWNCTVRPRRRDVSYLRTQLLVAQKEEAGIQLQAKEFDLMATVADLDEIEEVNANYILMANLQQASTSGTDKALGYDSDGSAENDNNVISEVSSVEQSGRTVEQHPANVKETRILYDSLYNNLEIEVEKVNTVNRMLRETNVELATELARYKTQEKCFEISQEKYDKLERRYQKSVYQE